MDSDATGRGITDHRVAHTFEYLATGFQRLGLSRRTAERLAEAHTLRLERDLFFARRNAAAGGPRPPDTT